MFFRLQFLEPLLLKILNFVLFCQNLPLLFSCQNDQSESADSNLSAVAAHRGCASQEVLAAQLKADPTLAIRMNRKELNAVSICHFDVFLSRGSALKSLPYIYSTVLRFVKH